MRLVLLAAALSGMVQEPQGSGVRALAGEEWVLDYFSDVFLRGALFRDTAETAAFLVRRNNGELQCLLWPATNVYKGHTFRGRVPEGTVAVIHTHPGAAFNPSAGDAQQARTIGLPIFVLTRGHVTAADAQGNTVRIVRRSWLITKVERRCEEKWVEPVRFAGERATTAAY